MVPIAASLTVKWSSVLKFVYSSSSQPRGVIDLVASSDARTGSKPETVRHSTGVRTPYTARQLEVRREDP